MELNSFNFWNSTFTDYLQSFAALLAITFAAIGLYISYRDLKQKNEEQQSQINYLIKNNELIEKSNQINSDILTQITNYLLKGEKDTSKLLELQKEIRINNIKPIFNIDGVDGSTYQVNILFTNLGGIAQIKDILVIDHNYRFESNPRIGNNIDSKQKLKISVYSYQGGDRLIDSKFSIKINYQDIEKNNYSIIVNIDRMKIKLIEDL